MSTPANKLTADLLIAIPREFPQCRVWRNNRVDALVPGAGGRIRRVQAGIDGQADLSGVMAPSGRRVEIEVKAGRDRQSDAQKAFQKMITEFGGIYIVARSVEQCIEELGGVRSFPHLFGARAVNTPRELL